MKKHHLFMVLIGLVLSSLLIACNPDISPAENVAENLFEAIKSKDFNKTLGFYDAEFFVKVSRDDWLKTLQTINVKLGDLQAYKIDFWEVSQIMGSEGNVTYYKLKYQVTYSKYQAVETITVSKPSNGNEFKIVSHNINSEGFIKE